MRFAHPWFLLLLGMLPVLVWLHERRTHQPAFLYSSVALVKHVAAIGRSHVGKILSRLRWFAVALCIVGLARPQLGLGEAKIRAAGIDIVVALDISGSMRSEDFHLRGRPANRLDVAKEVLISFIRKRPNDRIGLVAFAARPYIAAPPTLDHDFLLETISHLNIGTIEDGTAIGSALTAALNRLRDVQGRTRIIILMTDGQNNAGKVPPLTAAEAAQALNIKVYTIGVGTRGKAPLPVIQNGYRVTRMVDVNIDEDTLKQIAQRTGGEYFRATDTERLRQIYDHIDRLEKTEIEARKYQRYEELFPWVVLPAFVLLMLELVLSQTVWRRLP
ncbi:MAG: VWA domain-containing protein [Verrucomicrobiae bacterium]|nr:VWA domain-containing protein [Verrucomicrobiae bacterium]